MGNKASSSGSSHIPKGKKVVNAKIESASKTGVLNLTGQDLKPSSSIWTVLNDPIYINKLTTLDLSHNNKLSTLPTILTSFTTLKNLVLSHCEISLLPDLSSLVSLVNLKVDHNHLTITTILPSLPANLVKVDFSYNHLINIPIVLTSLSKLVELDLSHNQIDDITATVGLNALLCLSHLVLDYNMITSLPTSLVDCPRLQSISLRFNRLSARNANGEQSIPIELLTKSTLISLELEGNPLTKAQLLDMDGIDALLERRKMTKDKVLQGGGLMDMSLFGLD
eukprot:gene3248-3558_t